MLTKDKYADYTSRANQALHRARLAKDPSIQRSQQRLAASYSELAELISRDDRVSSEFGVA